MVYYLKLSKVMVVESIMTIYIYIFDYLIYVQFKININEWSDGYLLLLFNISLILRLME